jgi:hypothetical protein
MWMSFPVILETPGSPAVLGPFVAIERHSGIKTVPIRPQGCHYLCRTLCNDFLYVSDELDVSDFGAGKGFRIDLASHPSEVNQDQFKVGPG